MSVIVEDGIKRMYQNQQDRLYYLALYNEFFTM